MPESKDICLPLTDDLALIKEAILHGGAIARDAFHANDSKVWDKAGNHPVTDADIAVNDYLRDVLMRARPNYGWLSEETKDDYSRRSCPRTFVIDPIDGTRAFIDRSANFAVSIAIIEDGQSVVGALYNPLTEELFTATKGGGAALNGEAIKPSSRAELEGCRMIGYPRKFRRQGWPAMNVHIANSMAYRIALVACGQADATVAFTPKSDWDVAAAALIATESGAQVTDLYGKPFRYDREGTSQTGVICAGAKLMPLIKTRMKSLIDAAARSDNPARDFAYLGTRMSDRKTEDTPELLHIVFGGELVDPMKTKFIDLSKVHFVGAYPNYAKAHEAWKSSAQRTVDNAHMRYFILHAHELIDPDKDGIIG
ncbi:inositol monophosphatase family protein [Fretibacter rubidus]|uniref:inositol monophosphatase family protein n=1 Tax=Fretibacter rubidus TaxID=570162 RepID=UPI00352BBA3E